jgi:hypothetical protein
VGRYVEIFPGAGLEEMEEEGTEEIRCIDGKHQPAGKGSPIQGRCQECPDAECKIRIPHLERSCRQPIRTWSERKYTECRTKLIIPTTPTRTAAAIRTAISILMNRKKMPINIPIMDRAMVAPISSEASRAVGVTDPL